MDNRAIGYMDSGVGGLSVVKQALAQLPNEQVKYVGDTKHMPYGPKRPEDVLAYTQAIAEYLLQEDIKILVIACNTATAVGLPVLQAALPIPVVGVIHPGVQAALHSSVSGRIGVIATEGTVSSAAYPNAILAAQPTAEVVQLATPALVQLAEHADLTSAATQATVQETLLPLQATPIDTLIMGCTHFPLMAQQIQVVMGQGVKLIDAGAAAIDTVEAILDQQGLRHGINPMSDHAQDQYFTTGDPSTFQKIAEQWLDLPVSVKHIVLDEK